MSEPTDGDRKVRPFAAVIQDLDHGKVHAAASSALVELVDAVIAQGKKGQSGEITIPEVIDLALAPFEGAGDYLVKAKFRYRIGSGGLRLAYELDRPERVVEAAFADVVDTVEEATSRTVLHGSPA